MSQQHELGSTKDLEDVHSFLIQQFLRLGYLPQSDSAASSLEISQDDLTGRCRG